LPVLRFPLAVFFGTFCPAALASERPIAIACFRLFTFLPERPLFNVPRLRSRIARATFDDAFFEYFCAMIFLPVARNQSTQAIKVPRSSPSDPISRLPFSQHAGHEIQASLDHDEIRLK
jgi:hypothetical protein